MKLLIRHLVCVAGVCVVCAPLAGQELIPRAYWPAPKGTRIVGVGYGYTKGDVVVDPAVPVEDVESETHSAVFGYYQAFSLAGRSATVSATLPAAAARFEGELSTGAGAASVSGISDLRVRLGVNLVGAPSMTPEEFREFLEDPPGHQFGASLLVQIPTGEYNNDRVANVGTSRWSVKPELGYIGRISRRWGWEGAAGVWFYGENDDFLGGRLEQDPMLGAEFHLVHLLSKGRWFSVDLNYYAGGRTEVDGVRKDNRQKNSRIGATLAVPVGRHVFKLAVSDSLRIKEGGDYRAALLGWAYVWN